MPRAEHLTLSRFLQLVKSRIDEAFPLSYWIMAEISEININYSGHCYLELVEKGGTNQVPRAKISAVIWRSTFGALSGYFRSATGQELQCGMKILFRSSLNFHELYGISLVISDIDPLYTLGDIERQRQETIERLRQEGIFDMNKSLEIPIPAQKIAVISSRNAAGYQDFMNELGSGGYYFKITLFDSFMQGYETEASVISALERIAACGEDFDAVVIIRGGGLQSNLAAFDSYRICCHLAQFPIPVITGIGHDKDNSIADLVACVSLKTPTAVAAWLNSAMGEFDSWLDSLRETVLTETVALLEKENRKVRDAASGLMTVSNSFTRTMELKLEKLMGGINLAARTMIPAYRSYLTTLGTSLGNHVSTTLLKERNRLSSVESLLDSNKPERILSLGFAIVRKDGKTLRDISDIFVGDNLDITVAGGSLDTQVTKIKNGKRKK